MKDLSNYITSILDDSIKKLKVDYKVIWYDEGTYVIKVYLKGIEYISNTVESYIRMSVDKTFYTYFPKGSIKYVINLLYLLP